MKSAALLGPYHSKIVSRMWKMFSLNFAGGRHRGFHDPKPGSMTQIAFAPCSPFAVNKPLLVAILDGAHQIATPTFIGTLSICIVFFPVVLLTGVARFLFTPLALAAKVSVWTMTVGTMNEW